MSSLKSRIERLENLRRQSPPRGCNCRQMTWFHTAAELEAIMAIPCPVHGLRRLGFICAHPLHYPLDPEHQHLCCCPPDSWREFLEGKRGRPTEEEKNEAIRRHNEEVKITTPEESARSFAEEKARLDALFERYRQSIRAAHSGCPEPTTLISDGRKGKSPARVTSRRIERQS